MSANPRTAATVSGETARESLPLPNCRHPPGGSMISVSSADRYPRRRATATNSRAYARARLRCGTIQLQRFATAAEVHASDTLSSEARPARLVASSG